MQGLLFYEAPSGTGEFYKVNSLGELAMLRGHTGWRETWTKVIPGHFAGGEHTGLLFYEGPTGTGEFYATDGQGGMPRLQTHTGWRETWTEIVPGNYAGGSDIDDLLFYEGPTGTGEFYASDGQGGMSLLQTHTGWRETWTEIVPGDFGGAPGLTDLLFYEASTGTGEFYASDGQGGISLLQTHTGWRNSWTRIIPGNFGGGNTTDLLFYEGSTGLAEFYATDGQGGISQVGSHSGWPTNPSAIIPVSIGGSGYTDLLFYEAASGTGTFYTQGPAIGLDYVFRRRHTDWRTTWAIVLPGSFGGSDFTNLTAPTQLEVKSVSDRRIDLAWMHQASSETGFRIEFDGRRTGFTDHQGTKDAGPSDRTASLTGLRSGFEYRIRVRAFNQAGESAYSNEVRATTPSRTIEVAKEGAGTATVLIVSGAGFTAGSLAVSRVTATNWRSVQFAQTVGADGKFKARQGISCDPGQQLTIDAFEDSDPNGTMSNSIVTTCP